MSTQFTRAQSWLAPAVLLLVGAGVIAAYSIWLPVLERTPALPGILVSGACLLSAIAIFSRARRPDAWRNGTWLGLGVLGLGVISAWITAVGVDRASAARVVPFDAAFVVVAMLFLIPLLHELRSHVPVEDRREVAADVVLISAAIGTIV